MADQQWARPQGISRLAWRLTLVVTLLAAATNAAAQSPSPKPQVPSPPSIEVVPFGGYRIGSSGAMGRSSMPIVFDAGGGVSFGALVDVPYGPPQDGLKFEVLFSHESSWVEAQGLSLFDPKVRVDVTIDHLMVGGVQELDDTPGRAFIGGLVGLSRFAAPDEVDIGFTIGLAAGAKFFANRHVGLRLDARGYMTIIGIGGVVRCSGGCVAVFKINPAFQADFTAGMIIAF